MIRTNSEWGIDPQLLGMLYLWTTESTASNSLYSTRPVEKKEKHQNPRLTTRPPSARPRGEALLTKDHFLDHGSPAK